MVGEGIKGWGNKGEEMEKGGEGCEKVEEEKRRGRKGGGEVG